MAANGSSPGSIKVGIVGAGVAGLAAGIALRRIGHDVEVSHPIKTCYLHPQLPS